MTEPRPDVVIVRPPFARTAFDQRPQEALGLGYLLACLRDAGLRAQLIDCELQGLSAQDAASEIAWRRPALVGLSVMSRASLVSAMEIARQTRQWAAPEASVVIGGHLPSFIPGEILQWEPSVDAVALHEGEALVAPLARAARDGRDLSDVPGLVVRGDAGAAQTGPAPPIHDLDALPLAARDVWEAGLTGDCACSVSSSRGCIGNCSFCTIHVAHRRAGVPGWRGRDPLRVVDELELLGRRYAATSFTFVDEDFIGRPGEGWGRARQIAAEISRRGLDIRFEFECRPDCLHVPTFRALRAAGLHTVFVGVESIIPRTQRLFRKIVNADDVRRNLAALREMGVRVRVGYIPFDPWTGLDEVAESIGFLVEAGADDPHTLTNCVVADVGAPLLDDLAGTGLLCAQPGGRYETRFEDPRVAALHRVAQMAIRPLFPYWYEAFQQQTQALCRGDRAGREEADGQLRECGEVAADLLRQAAAALREGPIEDLCGLARSLRAQGFERVQMRPGATQGCEQCADQTGSAGT